MSIAILALLVGAVFHKPILRLVAGAGGCLAMFLCCAVILVAWVIWEIGRQIETAWALVWAFGRRTA